MAVTLTLNIAMTAMKILKLGNLLSESHVVISIQIQKQINPFVFCTMNNNNKKNLTKHWGKCRLRDLCDVPASFLEGVENKDEGKSHKQRRAAGGQGGMGDVRTVRLPEGNFTILNS